MDEFLMYLLQVAVCHTGFFILYKVFYERLVWFHWNRLYLISAVFVGFMIPALRINAWDYEGDALWRGLYTINDRFSVTPADVDLHNGASISTQGNVTEILLGILCVIYISGVLLRFFVLAKALLQLKYLIAGNGKNTSNETVKVVDVARGPTVFSFLNYVFINRQKCSLTPDEEEQILLHEQVHVEKRHTYDVVLLEVAAAVCWFNPFIWKIKKCLVQVHEYQADQAAVHAKGREEYFQLILKLAQGDRGIPLIHHFSYLSLRNRINMLHSKNNSKMKKFRFMMVLPAILVFVSLFSFTKKAGVREPVAERIVTEEKVTVKSINWEGNKQFSDEMLSKVAGVRVGMTYDRKLVESNIGYRPEGDDLGALYMDRGYAYFNVEIQEEVSNDKVDLTFIVHEGDPVYINNVVVKGNKKHSVAEIAKWITIEKGELFSRKELIQSQKNLSGTGWFVADKIHIQPVPQEDMRKMDIEFTVTELAE